MNFYEKGNTSMLQLPYDKNFFRYEKFTVGTKNFRLTAKSFTYTGKKGLIHLLSNKI